MKLSRKWILVVSLVMSLAMATTGTLAYLRDSDTKTNTFTLGNVDIQLTEPKYDAAKDHVLSPGATVAKDPTISNISKTTAYVWMDVVLPDDVADYITWTLNNGWSQYKKVEGDTATTVTLKYASTLAENESTSAAFDTITLAESIPSDVFNALADEISIVVNAYAIEAAAFETFDLAYAAYNNESNPDTNAWDGTIPATLADTTLDIVPGGGTQTGTITVKSAKDLVYLTKLSQEWVSLYSNNQGTSVSNYREANGGKGTDYYYHWTWTVKLGADINLNNKPLDSIVTNYWGDFDGDGHTISNVVLNDGQTGLFNGMQSHSIRNLRVENIAVNAPGASGVGALTHRSGTLNNVHLINASVKGGKYTGGIAGISAGITNCSVKTATITATTDKTSGGLVGYAVGDPGAITVTGNKVEDVQITGTYNVGGLLGQAQYGTFENNTVKNVTVISTTDLPADASTNEVRAAEVVARVVSSAEKPTTIGTNSVESVTLSPAANP